MTHTLGEPPGVAGPEGLPELESLLQDAHPRFNWSEDRELLASGGGQMMCMARS